MTQNAALAGGRAAHVLLVEDDTNLRLVTRLACESAGFAVREASTGAAALEAAARARPDVVLLDLMLPDMDGYDVCRALRQRDARLPIIMVTARGEETDKVVGLELGADEYLTKPYGTRELIARIRTQLRRARLVETTPSPVWKDGNSGPAHAVAERPAEAVRESDVQVGALRVLPDEREVYVDGQPVRLTRTEFDLLSHLARHAGKALSRAQLVAAVWGYDSDGGDRLVDSHIKNLRRKLAAYGPAAPEIGTVPQIGYKLVRR